MKKAQRSRLKSMPRRLSLCKYQSITRIYAHLGRVTIENDKGEVSTMSPHEAARRACGVNAAEFPEPSARAHAAMLVEDTIAAVREAMKQREIPDSKDTAAVTQALRDAQWLNRPPSAQENIDLMSIKVELPMMDADEILAVMRHFTEKPLSYVRGFLKAVHADRLEVFMKTGKLTDPVG